MCQIMGLVQESLTLPFMIIMCARFLCAENCNVGIAYVETCGQGDHLHIVASELKDPI